MKSSALLLPRAGVMVTDVARQLGEVA